ESSTRPRSSFAGVVSGSRTQLLCRYFAGSATPASFSISAASTSRHLTATPGATAPISANILPPTFQASWPPPHGSETSAPGRSLQISATRWRKASLISALPLGLDHVPDEAGDEEYHDDEQHHRDRRSVAHAVAVFGKRLLEHVIGEHPARPVRAAV